MTPGTLYVVATPIGNLEDITYRAVAVLEEVDVIASEDTRHSQKLLDRYAIATPQISFHEHNEQTQTRYLLVRLHKGESVALISDAGTPLISDPGYHLVAAVQQSGIKVSPIPGPSALITALSVAGLPTDRFVFEGFLPAKTVARQKRLQNLASETRTLIFYESSHRIIPCLKDMCDCLGQSRVAVIARELTKRFEHLQMGTLDELRVWVQLEPNNRRGEFVVLVKGATRIAHVTDERITSILSILVKEVPVNTAVRLAAQITGERKNRVYRLALSL